MRPVQRQMIKLLEYGANRHFQRGRGTQACTLRNITGDHQICAAEVFIALLQMFNHPTHVV
ncbi:hypothetical protein D3C71_2066900 [compost metagenome]